MSDRVDDMPEWALDELRARFTNEFWEDLLGKLRENSDTEGKGIPSESE